MKLRIIHRWFAFIFSPFLIIIACTAILLMLSTSNLVSFPAIVEKWVFKIHTWKIIGTYIGLLFPLMMLVIAITGIMIFLKTEFRRIKISLKSSKTPDNLQ